MVQPVRAVTTVDLGTEGYWHDPTDVVPSDPSRSVGALISPPTGWPKPFSDNAALKGLMGRKGLAGKRCRLTAPPPQEDIEKLASVPLAPDNSFANAEAVQQAVGWQVIKGFAIYEIGETSGGAFVAHKRWWNQKDSGVWVDLTPRASGVGDLVLLESALSTKTMTPMTDATRAAVEKRLQMGGIADIPAAAAPSQPAVVAVAMPPKPKPKPKPPPTPPKLEFKGSETLEETVELLVRGNGQAQTRAAASLAAQAATGPDESKRIVAAGAVQPLLLLFRGDGEQQEHAARAIMSEHTPLPQPKAPDRPRPTRQTVPHRQHRRVR